MVKSPGQRFIEHRTMRNGNWKLKQWCVGVGISGLILKWKDHVSLESKHNMHHFPIVFKINSSAYKIKLLFNKMEILLRSRLKLMLGSLHSDWSSYPDFWNHESSIVNLLQILSRQTSEGPVSEYLSPETKTVIEYDCMPTFANILVATIVDIDDNRVIKSFAIKKGIELENKVNLFL